MSAKQFAEYQRQLAEVCRADGSLNIPGTASEKRVAVYRKLVFSNVKNSLDKAYPISRKALGEDWNCLVEEFFAEHPCRSPHLWRMPRSLLEYVEQEQSWQTKFPFLQDLLLFEWLEIEVYMMADKPIPAVKTEGDLRHDIPAINPEHRLVVFRYPVFRLKASELQQGLKEHGEQAAYPLLLYRHPETKKVHFLDLSPFLAHLFATLYENPAPIPAVLSGTAAAFGVAEDKQSELMPGVAAFISELQQRQAILGYLA